MAIWPDNPILCAIIRTTRLELVVILMILLVVVMNGGNLLMKLIGLIGIMGNQRLLKSNLMTSVRRWIPVVNEWQ